MTVLDLKNQLDQPNAALHVYDQNNNEKLDTASACTKDTIVFSVDGVTLDTKKFIQKGDLNCDGTIDIKDERIIVEHDSLGGTEITDPDILYAADINDDGQIDYRDIARIVSYCARTITNGLSTNKAWMNVQGPFIIYNAIYGSTLPTQINPPVLVSELKTQLNQTNSLIHVYDVNGNEAQDSDPVGTKMVIKYISNGSILDSKNFVLKGNVAVNAYPSGTGWITMADYGVIVNDVSGSAEIPVWEFEIRNAADVDDDNSITQNDADLVHTFWLNTPDRQ